LNILHFQRIATLDCTKQRQQNFEERNSVLEVFLVFVAFVSRYTFSDPRQQIGLDLNDVLARESLQNRPLTSTNDETRREELGELDSISFIADNTIQNKCISLGEK
jgi:hypothetical protein